MVSSPFKKIKFAWDIVKHPLSFLVALRYDVARLLKPSTHSTTPPPQPQQPFLVVYFSCRKHIDLLLNSLLCLYRFGLNNVDRVVIVEDVADPFRQSDKENLKRAFAGKVEFKESHYPMAWGGTRLLVNELSAFKAIAATMHADQVLVKMDSDAVLVSSELFGRISQLDFDLAGQRYESRVAGKRVCYLQGGCYFVRKKALLELSQRSLVMGAIKASWHSKRGLPEIPEDHYMYLVAKHRSLNVVLLDFYLSEQFAAYATKATSPARLLHSLADGGRSVVHFEHTKHSIGRFVEVMFST